MLFDEPPPHYVAPKRMPSDISTREGMIGRFAVVKLWPEIKTAEDECIARLKLAAESLGLECVEILADGHFREDPSNVVSRDNVDFVLHLHYDTPKNYDAFSFVALWNPIKFYHEWGYHRCSRNLVTHDDFVSCGSDAADAHVGRMVRRTKTHLAPRFRMYHSTPGNICAPTQGDGRLFYAGINWEAITGGKSRHQEVLKALDKSGLLRIYGPEKFQGVRVWEGYNSYVKEIPFDGISMIKEIASASAALVFSSQAHKDSSLMSNRLFETVAAGTLAICDENPFARKFFGDSVLYIDTRAPVDQQVAELKEHLEWIRQNPELAMEKNGQAQALMSQQFSLTHSLSELYAGLGDRKNELRARSGASSTDISVRLNLLMPEYSQATLQQHIKSARIQDYGNLHASLVIDRKVASNFRAEITAQLDNAGVPIELREVDFFEYGPGAKYKQARPLGAVIFELLDALQENAFMLLAPNETALSNHVSTLAGALNADSAINCAATAALLIQGETPIHGVHEVIDFERLDSPGYGRFIFRTSALPNDLHLALPFLAGRALAVLVGDAQITQLLPASFAIQLDTNFPLSLGDSIAECRIVHDYTPKALTRLYGPNVATLQNSLDPIGQSFQNRLISPRWYKAQLAALKKYGVRARFKALKRKLSS